MTGKSFTESSRVNMNDLGFRAICGTLCLCQALAVLSAVSIIYLSVIIYLPAKREMESGIGETPVMCTTVEDRRIDNDMEACK